MTKKAKKRAATAGAVVMMLGVLHLSTKDASGQENPAPATTTTPCVDEYHGPDGTVEEVPCDQWSACPGVMLGWKVPTKYYPDRCPPPTKPVPHPTNTVVTVQPPMEGAPATTTVTLAPPVSIVAAGPVDPPLPTLAVDTTTTTERIEEDDPRFDCKTMGNKRCGPTATTKPKLALPATE